MRTIEKWSFAKIAYLANMARISNDFAELSRNVKDGCGQEICSIEVKLPGCEMIIYQGGDIWLTRPRLLAKIPKYIAHWEIKLTDLDKVNDELSTITISTLEEAWEAAQGQE